MNTFEIRSTLVALLSHCEKTCCLT